MIDLKKQYGRKFRITLDESFEIGDRSNEEKLWNLRIPGKYGHIGVWGENTLSAHSGSSRVVKKLIEIPGVTIKQRGDNEVTIVFPPDLIEPVADVLKAKRRRQLSDEHRAKLIEASASHRFKGADNGSN
jgi:hypothetical protein